MTPALGGVVRAVTRGAAGPLAMVAFFCDWFRGSGILAGHSFSGFDLVGFTGRLQALDLQPWETVALGALRIGVLCVAVAAAWQIVLMPGRQGNVAYAASGWYLAGAAAVVVTVGLVRDGLMLPAGGPLLALAAAAFVVGHRVQRRTPAVPRP